MKAYYCDHFVLPLPETHRFPITKYSRLRGRIESSGLELELVEPRPADDTLLRRVHDADYVTRTQSGALDKKAVRRMGFPWSPQLVERSRRSVGATVAAAETALGGDGVAVNLAGGTHHAFADRGEGFCVFNDAAVAIRHQQALGRIDRALIVDCDVHQGNGSAAIFRDDPSVFTLSMHGRRNYPFQKETSDLDVELEDGTGDDEYLDGLEAALDRVLPVAGAQLVIYLAGADPFSGDKLGRLGLSKDGLQARDRLVLERCRQAGLPVAVAMAGGYAPAVEDIVDIHFNTVREALRSFSAQAAQAPASIRAP